MQNKSYVITSVIIYGLISGIGGIIAISLMSDYFTYMIYCLIVQLLLVLWAKKSYKKLGDNEKLNGKVFDLSIGWMVPHYLLLILLIKDISGSISGLEMMHLKSLGVYFITCILIGISEELMFRGAILQYFSKIPKKKAVIYSAFLFSLFHLSNYLITGNVFSTIVQLVTTFIFGLFAGGVVLKQKTLVPMIIYHGLWDFTMQLYTDVGLNSQWMNYSQLLNLLIAVILLVSLSKEDKKDRMIGKNI